MKTVNLTLHPKVRIFSLEPDPSDFQLVTANTNGLSIGCIQRGVAELGAGHRGPACTTINKRYETAPDAAPAIVATLNDCLIPGTAHSGAFVEAAATRNRDFVYVEDNVFSISRDVGLLKAA